MNILNNVKRMFRDPSSRAARDPAVRAIRDAAAETERSRLPQMAAALAFRTIFAFIPMAVVALVIIRGQMTVEDRHDVIARMLSFTAVSNITVPPAEFVGPTTPLESTDLTLIITDLVDRADRTVSFKALGWIGFVTLLYAAIAMLVEIERAFNQVFRVPRGRSWTRRIVNYWTILTLGGIGLVATFYVGARFESWANDIVSRQGFALGSGEVTVRIIGYSVTVVISTILLTLMYALVPNTRVRAAAALVGAFIGALLWEAGKAGFQQYIHFSASYAKVYGTMALIPLFLLWVYYTWLIVLFGLLITHQLQHGRNRTSAQPLSDSGPTIVEPSAGLVVMTAMARAMAAGTPQTVKSLCVATGLAESVVAMVVARYAERGLLLRVERGNPDHDETQYTMARAPGAVRVAEVLSIAFDLAGGPESNPVIERMRKAQIDAAGSETLADAAAGRGIAGGSSPRVEPQTGQNPPMRAVGANGSGGSGGSRSPTIEERSA